MIDKLDKGPWARRAIAGASVGCVLAGALACSSPPEAVVVPEPVGAPPAVAVAAAPAPPMAAGAAPRVVAPAAPSHGGTVVMAGAHPVEVVPHASGQVYAYVQGDVPPESAELSVIVPVTGGLRTVELAWEPGERRWAGRVRRAEIVPGPIDVVLVTGGTRWVGHVATIVVAPAIVIAAEPTIVIEHVHGKHRKHGKHRGWGRGHGRGHGRIVRWH